MTEFTPCDFDFEPISIIEDFLFQQANVLGEHIEEFDKENAALLANLYLKLEVNEKKAVYAKLFKATYNAEGYGQEDFFDLTKPQLILKFETEFNLRKSAAKTIVYDLARIDEYLRNGDITDKDLQKIVAKAKKRTRKRTKDIVKPI